MCMCVEAVLQAAMMSFCLSAALKARGHLTRDNVTQHDVRACSASGLEIPAAASPCLDLKISWSETHKNAAFTVWPSAAVDIKAEGGILKCCLFTNTFTDDLEALHNHFTGCQKWWCKSNKREITLSTKGGYYICICKSVWTGHEMKLPLLASSNILLA